MPAGGVPLWVTITLGAFALVGPLVSAWVTQWLTTRREANRDALRWAQERQQRRLDAQAAAMTDALTALHNWHSELNVRNMHLVDPLERTPSRKSLAALEVAAKKTLGPVELFCSKRAASATADAIVELEMMAYHLVVHEKYVSEPDRTGVDVREYDRAVAEVVTAYREELAKLSAEPVAVSGAANPRRKRFKRGSDPQQP